MEMKLKLYMALLGCTPKNRLTEQHDIFFGIGESLIDLKPDMYDFWNDGGQLHVDSWREITHIDGYAITIVPKEKATEQVENLYLINLGGYKPGELEEYHYKALVVGDKMSTAIKASKKTTFYKHYGFKGAESHIDEKYGLDVDDMHKVADILPERFRELYHIKITKTDDVFEDKLHIGYFMLGKR